MHVTPQSWAVVPICDEMPALMHTTGCLVRSLGTCSPLSSSDSARDDLVRHHVIHNAAVIQLLLQLAAMLAPAKQVRGKTHAHLHAAGGIP